LQKKRRRVSWLLIFLPPPTFLNFFFGFPEVTGRCATTFVGCLGRDLAEASVELALSVSSSQ